MGEIPSEVLEENVSNKSRLNDGMPSETRTSDSDVRIVDTSEDGGNSNGWLNDYF